MAKQYIAFISYRHAELDSAIAKQLHTLIEQYRIPKGLRKDNRKRLGIVFRDEEELPAASNLTTEIQTALDNTSYLIVICSKDAIQSPWCAREIDYFLQHHDRSHVLAVLASGEPVDVFPKQLTMSPDGPDAPPIEPLALDVRAESIAASCKKLRKGILRLISSILGCPYDALVMREQKRKTRRITAIAAGAMAILLGFTSMVLAKNQEIALANTQLEHKNVELNDANTALAEQKAAVQLRESQLLTQNAQEQLENADYYGAIETALSALPKDETDDRPYYAPAENILVDAMGIFNTKSSSAVLNTTVLEQVANIADYTFSQDGTRVVTVDEFGTTFCFDTRTGTQLWNSYAALEDSSLSTINPHVILCNDDQTVVRSAKKSLTGYDMQTGNLLWSADLGYLVEDYLFYHPERNVLVVGTFHTVEIFSTQYDLVEMDASTGEILHTIPLLLSPNSISFTFSSSYVDTLAHSGRFSNDGTEFYGVFIDDNKQMQCFLADLTKGTSQIVYTHDTPMFYNTDVLGIFARKDGPCHIICKGPSDDIMISAITVNLDTGKLLWQQDIPCQDTIYSSFDLGFALFLQKGILISCVDTFYYLDATSGEILGSKTVPREITSLQFVSDYDFGYSLKDGTYGIGWIQGTQDITLTTDADWLMYASLKTHQDFRVWNGGIVQMNRTDTGFWLGIGTPVSPGYVALIPEKVKNTLEIIRPVEALQVLEHTPLELPIQTGLTAYDVRIQPVGSQLVVGPFNHPEDSSKLYYYLDPATCQVTDSFNPKETYYAGELFWLPDTMQPLICNSYKGLFTLAPDGTPELLCDPQAEQAALREKDGWWYDYGLFCLASGYQTGDTTLLSAATSPKTLQIWNNGKFLRQTDLPEPLLIPPKEDVGMTRLLKVGANGWVVTSLHKDYGTIPAKKMAAYNPAQDVWTCLRGNAVFSDENAIAFAQSKAIMAGVDQDSNLLILDLNTGNVVTQFPTQIPSGSVLKMQFFLDDTHLAIKAAGGHLLIYEIRTGKLLYQDQLSNTTSSVLEVFEDPKHQRLYLNCGPYGGLCLDQSSWTALARSVNMIFYDKNADRVYLGSNGDIPVVYGQIPDTMGLVKLAGTVLAEQK